MYRVPVPGSESRAHTWLGGERSCSMHCCRYTSATFPPNECPSTAVGSTFKLAVNLLHHPSTAMCNKGVFQRAAHNDNAHGLATNVQNVLDACLQIVRLCERRRVSVPLLNKTYLLSHDTSSESLPPMTFTATHRAGPSKQNASLDSSSLDCTK